MKKTWKLIASLLVVMMLAVCVVNAGMYDDTFNGLTLSEYALYEQGTLDAVQMRAFAVDPNGKYYYGGLLNGGTPTVYQFDINTKEEVCTYTFDEDPGSYIKAIATDDRGYVYMGVATPSNTEAVYFAICKEAGLEEVKWVKIDIPGKVGVNGACVWNNNGKYYLYFVTNYETDRIYCYDVTDVSNPVLNTAFGNGEGGGYVDLNNTFAMQDANNLAIGTDGMLYMAATTGKGSKGDTVFKIDNKGVGTMATAEVNECFGVCTIGAYLAVCTYEGADSRVVILDQADLSQITEVSYDDANNFCQLGFVNNRLYMADQGPDAVLVSSEIIFPIADTEPVTDNPAIEPAGDETPDAGNNDAPVAPTTADAGIVAAASLLLAAAACVVLSKKH